MNREYRPLYKGKFRSSARVTKEKNGRLHKPWVRKRKGEKRLKGEK